MYAYEMYRMRQDELIAEAAAERRATAVRAAARADKSRRAGRRPDAHDHEGRLGDPPHRSRFARVA